MACVRQCGTGNQSKSIPSQDIKSSPSQEYLPAWVPASVDVNSSGLVSSTENSLAGICAQWGEGWGGRG